VSRVLGPASRRIATAAPAFTTLDGIDPAYGRNYYAGFAFNF